MKQIFGRCLEVVAVNRKEKRSIQAQASEEKRSGGEGRLGVGSAIKDKREKHMRELRAYEDMCIDDALLCVSFAKFFFQLLSSDIEEEWFCYRRLALLKRIHSIFHSLHRNRYHGRLQRDELCRRGCKQYGILVQERSHDDIWRQHFNEERGRHYMDDSECMDYS